VKRLRIGYVKAAFAEKAAVAPAAYLPPALDPPRNVADLFRAFWRDPNARGGEA
jgi:hypothetical protein